MFNKEDRMRDEPFLINPPRRRRKRKSGGVKKVLRRRRRKVSVKKVSRRRKRPTAGLGRRHRPVVYGSGRTWRRSSASRSKARGIMINPPLALVGNPRRRRTRRRYRRNPAALASLPNQIMAMLPLAVTGVASGVVHEMVPGFFNFSNVWMSHGAKTATAIFGGQVVKNFAGADHGMVWTVVGLGLVVKDLIRQFMPGVIPGLGYPGYYQATSIGAFPGEAEVPYNEIGAFVDEQYAYPDSGSYGMGESPYPY